MLRTGLRLPRRGYSNMKLMYLCLPDYKCVEYISVDVGIQKKKKKKKGYLVWDEPKME